MCLIFVFWTDGKLFLTRNNNQITVYHCMVQRNVEVGFLLVQQGPSGMGMVQQCACKTTTLLSRPQISLTPAWANFYSIP